jgi:hypothetical protein
MANRLGPIEIQCDAPPYSVVKACRTLDMQSPEDVRWCRMSYHLSRQPGWREMLSRDTWKSILGMTQHPDAKRCTCGGELPALVKYTFTYITGQEASYFLGQCPRCRAVFWEEA